MILYFTGTGNSRFIANQLGNLLEDEIVSMNEYIKSGKTGSFCSDNPFIFITPVYMSRMPLDVEKFLKNSTFKGNRTAYFIFAAAAAIGTAEKYCKKICAVTGLTFNSSTAIIMPANYVVMYDVTPKEKALSEAEKALPEIRKTADQIKSGRPLEKNPKTTGHKGFGMFVPMLNIFMTNSKPFTANEKCIGCGQCENLCPKNNISLKNKKPLWHDDCMQCMACISACPAKAINYGRKTQDRNRYYLNN